MVSEVPKLLFVKKYVGFQLSVHQGEYMLMLDSLAELTRNIEVLKSFTSLHALEFDT